MAGPLAVSVTVPPGDKGFFKVHVPKLPLTYAALELGTSANPLWAHLRIKREPFDISVGCVNEATTHKLSIKLLRHLRVTAGQIDHVPGYTDDPLAVGPRRVGATSAARPGCGSHLFNRPRSPRTDQMMKRHSIALGLAALFGIIVPARAAESAWFTRHLVLGYNSPL